MVFREMENQGGRSKGKAAISPLPASEDRLISQHSPGSAKMMGLSAPAQKDSPWDMDKHIPVGKLDTVPLFRDVSISPRDRQTLQSGNPCAVWVSRNTMALKSISRRQKISVVGELWHFQQSPLTHRLPLFPGSFPPRKAVLEL